MGHHVNTTHGFLSSVDYVIKNNANVYQIFLQNPRCHKTKRKSDELLYQLKNKLIKYNIKLVIHASYMLNLCHPCESSIHKNAIKSLCQDLDDSVKLGALGVIIHMGKNVKKLELTVEKAINNYVLGIKKILKNSFNNSTLIF